MALRVINCVLQHYIMENTVNVCYGVQPKQGAQMKYC